MVNILREIETKIEKTPPTKVEFFSYKHYIIPYKRRKFNYHDFIKSQFWYLQKQDWYSRHKRKCARCRTIKGIHLHHKKYPKNGRFLLLNDNAFVALCSKCHFKYHKKYGVFNYMQTTSNRFIKELGLAGSKN